jgi:galactose mutarotase-like enzyme/predicted dehydrogenase
MSFTITRRQFGRAPDGGEVDAWTLTSPEGMQVEVLTLGCIVRRLLVPDGNGVLADVVLGYDSLEEYLAGTTYFGAIVGRVAGRLTSGSFWLNGSPYKLTINDGLNHLHGGVLGFDKCLWQATPLFLENAVALELKRTSPDGEEGYPGTLEVRLRYILDATGELLIETEASTDRATPWSMTHHSYFNLSGEGSRSTLDHTLQIFADETIATDVHMTLLNRLEPVTQENDFRKARHLHDAIPELFQNHGDLYRLPLRREKSLAAILSHPKSGRLLEVWTDEQYLQLYTGKNIRDVRGKDHHVYKEYAGICLEAEGYPNGVLHPQLGDVVLQPGEVQCRSTAYRFLARPAIDKDPAYTYHPPMPARRDQRIGILGSGFIVNECHLVSYRRCGFNPVAIASRTSTNAERVAQRHGIEHVYATYEELLDDRTIEVLDIAVPPTEQPALIREACERRSVRAIHAQKPLALSFIAAVEAVELCERAGILLSVNQNMRYDPTVFAATHMLRDGYFGEPVFATIDMRGIPHWQPWQADTGGATLRIMSVHHFDCMRAWFGDPDGVFCSVRPDPRTRFSHSDGICTTILEYGNGLRCVVVDDVWTGPAREGAPADLHISWRIEGLDGLAIGDIGWCRDPYTTPSTMRYAKKGDNVFRQFCPKQSWFPDAFGCTMGQLLVALEQDTVPALSGRDHLQTLAIVEAAIKSAELGRIVSPGEVATGEKR